ncbi:MAG: ABC-2 family transporter protein [Anaerolineae bacterium]|nr:ABC-2 family transporter protein [Anaerolineae bacterium]MCO5189720.1 ABC-2 family transporter protein [Anaerolineae bacterium]MCO5193201.1 ABC-2 family transporter protein [Anaerolineae bacterium]MCO5205452.1 ABC-2 family transporter protein [Anaerolineae bacterium]
MRRYLTLFSTFLRLSVLGELEYRANFWVQILESILSLTVAVGGIIIVFDHTATLGDWSANQLLALVGVYIMIGGVITFAIDPSMQRFMQDVQKGTFDFVLTKPVDAQFMASTRQFQLWKLIDVVLGLAIIGWALWRMQAQITILQIVLAALLLGIGMVIVYSFWMILGTMAFWMIRVDNMFQIFNAMFVAGRWPVNIYPTGLRAVLTFVVPIAFAVTVPAEALIGRITPTTFALAFGVGIGLFVVARLFWRYGIRSYSGASA